MFDSSEKTRKTAFHELYLHLLASVVAAAEDK